MSTTRSHEAAPPGPDARLDLEKQPDKLASFASLWRRFGDCYRVKSETRAADTWVINDPALIRRVLVANHRNYTKGIGIERVRVLLGNGLMASEGEQWRRQRRVLQAGFHRPAIEGLLPVYIDQARELAGRWRTGALAGEAVNVTEAVSRASLRVVLRALFSEDFSRLEAAGETPFALLAEESGRDLAFAVRFRALAKDIQRIVDTRRATGQVPHDLLGHMMLSGGRDTGRPMSDRQLIDEVLTLIVAGHETTASSLSFLWYLLAANPTCLDKVVDEARTHRLDRLESLDGLRPLVWIPRVIKETLRLYPPGWLYTRRALAEDRLGEFSLPAETDVFICAWLLHRHPAYWEAPEAFRPERFSIEAEAARERFAYIPFSAGPRHCIGERFALVEMIIHLGVIAAVLRPEAIDGGVPALETDVNLRPRDPLFLKFQVTEASR